MRNFYVQTSYWEDFFDDKNIDSYYPIAFEVLSWIFRFLMLENTNELKSVLHLFPTGCIMDFCRNKREVTIKMRTADLCKGCSLQAKKKGVSIPITVDIFGGLEKMRQYLNYVNRLEYLQQPRKLVVKDRLQHITIPAILGNMYVPLKPKERAVYLFSSLCQKGFSFLSFLIIAINYFIIML